MRIEAPPLALACRILKTGWLYSGLVAETSRTDEVDGSAPSLVVIDIVGSVPPGPVVHEHVRSPAFRHHTRSKRIGCSFFLKSQLDSDGAVFGRGLGFYILVQCFVRELCG